MNLHYLQHVPFEGPANIGQWAGLKGHNISRTELFNNETLPETGDFDWLIIMGGPMNIYEEKKYPWLAAEKRFIEKAIAKGKVVLGICLGSQLIADVLGARVYQNSEKEIGWHPVSLTDESKKSSVFRSFPEKFNAFHWHGDTFNLPEGCLKIAGSEACENQAFEYKGRVIGLQFHLESSAESIYLLIQNCSDELVDGRYIQKKEEILSKEGDVQEIHKTMTLLLDSIENEFGK